MHRQAASHRVDARFTLPDGTSWGSTDPAAPVMHFVNPGRLYRRLGRDAKMAFGEAYVAGDWTPGPGPTWPSCSRRSRRSSRTWCRPRCGGCADGDRPPAAARHPEHPVTGRGTNISAHYDMSNELFSMFLDETMTYSSAWFIRLRARVARVGPDTASSTQSWTCAGVGEGTRLLEIGSGWGSLAIRAAQRGATGHHDHPLRAAGRAGQQARSSGSAWTR